MLQGAIFDFNGTLVLDSPLHETAWREFSVHLRGYELSSIEFEREVHGRVNRHILEYIVGRNLDDDEAKDLSAQKEQIYRDHCKNLGAKFCLSPGAERILNELVLSSTPITIATASELDNLMFFMETLNLSRWFDFEKIVFDDGTFPGKPAPDIFIKAAAKLELPVKECVVIEDSISGIEAAHRAHIGKIVAIVSKERHSAIRGMAHVNLVVESFNDLDIDNLLGAR